VQKTAGEGGDRPAFYGDFIEKGRDFIVRVKSRSVLSWNGLHEIRFLAENCTMRHRHHVTFDSHGRECNVPVSFGTMPARLPMFPGKQLHPVVVRGFGQQPMMLLTSLDVDACPDRPAPIPIKMPGSACPAALAAFELLAHPVQVSSAAKTATNTVLFSVIMASPSFQQFVYFGDLFVRQTLKRMSDILIPEH